MACVAAIIPGECSPDMAHTPKTSHTLLPPPHTPFSHAFSRLLLCSRLPSLSLAFHHPLSPSLAFQAWGQRIARIVGADKVWLMSDNYNATLTVAGGSGGASGGGLFSVVPAPLSCSPAHAAGVLGHEFKNHKAPGGFGGANWGPHLELARLSRSRHAVVRDVVMDGTSARDVCGPTWAADDGILLAAGAMLLANGLGASAALAPPCLCAS